MKKLLFVIASLALLVGAACSSRKSGADTQAAQSSDTQASSRADDNTSGILVAYFSATGTTESVARKIAAATGGKLHAITPEYPYSSEALDWHNKFSRSSIEMNDTTSRPIIVRDSLVMSQYDTIYLGYPIWWDKAPRVINTFIETHDLEGSKVIPFATSGGSSIDNSVNLLRRDYPNIDWQQGHLLNNPSEEDITALARQ